MLKNLGIVLALVAAGTVGLVVGRSQSAVNPPAETAAPQFIEVAEGSPPASGEPQVSDSELQLYIEVYNAMQADHGLEIEQALVGRGISLDEFRSIERRVQSRQPLVEKVRAALLEHAKQQAVFALNQAEPTATPGTVRKKK